MTQKNTRNPVRADGNDHDEEIDLLNFNTGSELQHGDACICGPGRWLCAQYHL